MSEFSPIWQEVVNIHRGWNAMPEIQNKLEMPVVDLDLLPQLPPREYQYHFEIMQDLEEVHERLPDEPGRDLVAQKIQASLTRLRVTNDARMDYPDYVRATMGVTPELVPEVTLDAWHDELDDRLQEEGLRFDERSKEAYDNRFRLRDKADIAAQLRRSMTATYRALGDYIDVPKIELEPEITEVDLPYSGYLSTRAGGEMFMEANVHPRVTHTLGSIALLAAHEYAGHAAQFTIWQQAIQRGEMNPALGFTTLHSAEVMQCEAVAQLAEQLLPDRNDWETDFELEHVAYTTAVNHNITVMANTGVSDQIIKDFFLRRRPFKENDDLDRKIAEMRDSVRRTYYASYWPSLKLIQPLLRLNGRSAPHSNNQYQLAGIIDDLYRQPQSWDEMQSTVSNL
jgi:hypothetical protein